MPSIDDLAVATGDDPFLRWAADRPGVRIWIEPAAAAVAVPALSRHDRVAIHGEPHALAGLLRRVLPEVGPNYRPFGPETTVVETAELMPELSVAGRFAWMETATAPAGGSGVWLTDDDLPEVEALLQKDFPDSYARPGAPGVTRWAAQRDEAGALAAVAADAWSSPRVGLMGGVATRSDQRGRGRAATLCAFVTGELLTGRDRVALFADYWNVAAVATYRKLGFALKPLAAAHQVTG
ncbi:GNAT family N-acetyltransferase [Actinoplanes sp. TRM 88003]|uniref:GNAT family N-acetyltransferase n=1 Tax=Paractinoplanes aksuensis TaxID=2939490 RepID=A0ABT1E0I4_9ACTN|nr:GNAT family N-acetyltransferase [Actinoplanes aksuensis]MCO8276612.1 GNAT family N-acetyltransferase [Actinoplanes aksuensis]